MLLLTGFQKKRPLLGALFLLYYSGMSKTCVEVALKLRSTTTRGGNISWLKKLSML